MSGAPATVQARLDALAAGDRERADALLAEDVVLRIPAKSSLAGVHNGRDEVARALAALDALTSPGEMLEYTRFSSQERVMLFYEHHLGGAVARSAVIHRATDGLITEIDVLSGYVDDVARAPLRR
jgi:ketosteroid isomerase-like protein